MNWRGKNNKDFNVGSIQVSIVERHLFVNVLIVKRNTE